MRYFFAPGKIGPNQIRGDSGGVMVIFDGIVKYSDYDSVGHDELLNDIASEIREEKMLVRSQGIRLYYAYTHEGIVLSGTREVDNVLFQEQLMILSKLVKRALK